MLHSNVIERLDICVLHPQTRTWPFASTPRWSGCRRWTPSSTTHNGRCAAGWSHNGTAADEMFVGGTAALLLIVSCKIARIQSERGIFTSFNSCMQGRFSFYMTSNGEEATAIGSAAALTLDDVVRAPRSHSELAPASLTCICCLPRSHTARAVVACKGPQPLRIASIQRFVYFNLGSCAQRLYKPNPDPKPGSNPIVRPSAGLHSVPGARRPGLARVWPGRVRKPGRRPCHTNQRRLTG